MSAQDHRRESKSDEPKTYILVDFGSQFYDSGLASLDRDCSGFGKLLMIGKLNGGGGGRTKQKENRFLKDYKADCSHDKYNKNLCLKFNS